MTVAPTAATLSLLAPSGATPNLPLWQTGQRLDAVVLAQTGAHSVSLRIGAHTLEAHSSTPLAPRTALQLEVVQGGRQAVLRIVPQGQDTDPLSAALRAALPRQLPLQEVFASLNTLLNASAAATLPTPALSLLKQLIEQLPGGGARLPADALKQALSDSGLLLENRLSQNTGERLTGDLKANLLRLLAALDQDGQNNAALRRAATAGLARIELHQLNTLAEPAPTTSVSAELPLRHQDGVDVFRLRIEKDAHAADEPARAGWTAWLRFDLPPHGPVHAKISLSGEQVSGTLWAERESGAELIKRNLSWLEQALTAAGLSVGQLQCHSGQPARDPFALASDHPLLDVRA